MYRKKGVDRGRKNKPIVSMSKEEREEAWDDTYTKEEGIIIEFNLGTHSGKIRSFLDGGEYKIDGWELVRTKIELYTGDKILFAPIEDPERRGLREDHQDNRVECLES